MMDAEPRDLADELAENAKTEARLARRARGEEIPPEEYTPTQREMERSMQFASKIRPRFGTIIIRSVDRSRTPRARAPRPQRRVRRVSSTTATAARGDPDLPPPALAGSPAIPEALGRLVAHVSRRQHRRLRLVDVEEAR